MLLYHYDNGMRSCVNHVTHVQLHTKLTKYLSSDLTVFTWHDGRYACADGQGLNHEHLAGVGLKAQPLTLIDDQRPIPESFMSPTTLKMLSKG